MSTNLIVEDGTGLPTANCYADVAFVNSYLTLRGRGTAFAALTQGLAEAAIVCATDYMERRFGMLFLSTRLNSGAAGAPQALSFPRLNLFSRDGYQISGVPLRLQQAMAEYSDRARIALLQPDPVTDPTGRAVVAKQTTVGPITTHIQYEPGAGISTMVKPYPAADGLLAEYVRAAGAMR